MDLIKSNNIFHVLLDGKEKKKKKERNKWVEGFSDKLAT